MSETITKSAENGDAESNALDWFAPLMKPERGAVGTKAQLQRAFTTPAALLGMGAAGIGGAGLMGYHSSKADRPGETPAERRRRILRDSVMGGTLGVGAVGAGSVLNTALNHSQTQPDWWPALKESLGNRIPLMGAGGVTGAALTARKHPIRMEAARKDALNRLGAFLGVKNPTDSNIISSLHKFGPTKARDQIAGAVRSDLTERYPRLSKFLPDRSRAEAKALMNLAENKSLWANPGSYFGRPSRYTRRVPFAGPSALGAVGGYFLPEALSFAGNTLMNLTK